MEATATTTNFSAPLAATSNEADCERVNIVLDQLLEGRVLDEDDADYLIHYADDCSPCFDSIVKQQVFVAFVKQKVNKKQVPASLSHTIIARLHAEMA